MVKFELAELDSNLGFNNAIGEKAILGQLAWLADNIHRVLSVVKGLLRTSG